MGATGEAAGDIYSLSPCNGTQPLYLAYPTTGTVVSFAYDHAVREATFCFAENEDAPRDDHGRRYPCQFTFTGGFGIAGYGKGDRYIRNVHSPAGLSAGRHHRHAPHRHSRIVPMKPGSVPIAS